MAGMSLSPSAEMLLESFAMPMDDAYGFGLSLDAERTLHREITAYTLECAVQDPEGAARYFPKTLVAARQNVFMHPDNLMDLARLPAIESGEHLFSYGFNSLLGRSGQTSSVINDIVQLNFPQGGEAATSLLSRNIRHIPNGGTPAGYCLSSELALVKGSSKLGAMAIKGLPYAFPIIQMPFDMMEKGVVDGAGMCAIRIGMYTNPYAIITGPLNLLGDLAEAPDIQLHSMNLELMKTVPQDDILTQAILAQAANNELMLPALMQGVQIMAKWAGMEAVSTENCWIAVKEHWPAYAGILAVAHNPSLLPTQLVAMSELANAPSVLSYFNDSWQGLKHILMTPPETLRDHMLRPFKLVAHTCQLTGSLITLPVQWCAQNINLGQYAPSNLWFNTRGRNNDAQEHGDQVRQYQGERANDFSAFAFPAFMPVTMPSFSTDRRMISTVVIPEPFALSSQARGVASFGLFNGASPAERQPFQLPNFSSSLSGVGPSPSNMPMFNTPNLGMPSGAGFSPTNFGTSNFGLFNPGNSFNSGSPNMPEFQTSFAMLNNNRF